MSSFFIISLLRIRSKISCWESWKELGNNWARCLLIEFFNNSAWTGSFFRFAIIHSFAEVVLSCENSCLDQEIILVLPNAVAAYQCHWSETALL